MILLTIVFWILVVLTAICGGVGEVYKGPYTGNSDMVKSSAQFWFVLLLVATVAVGVIRHLMSI